MTLKTFLTACFYFWTAVGFSQQVVPLYAGRIPGSRAAQDEEKLTGTKGGDTLVNNVSTPTLTVYLPEKGKGNGTAVIICPGGGYHILVINREGSRVAEAFRREGIVAVVLKYRLPDDRIMEDKTIGPLQDAQQAIKTVREHAAEWAIDPRKIGIMGFSAGGHLAATAGTHFGHAWIKNPEGTSLRPDFMILIYPIISLTDSLANIGSRENLLGATPSPDRVILFSNELQVTADTPPTFLAHATGDIIVSSENSLYFYEALRRNKVGAELHLYEKGEHGFLTNPPFEEWFGGCLSWMKAGKLVP